MDPQTPPNATMEESTPLPPDLGEEAEGPQKDEVKTTEDQFLNEAEQAVDTSNVDLVSMMERADMWAKKIEEDTSKKGAQNPPVLPEEKKEEEEETKKEVPRYMKGTEARGKKGAGKRDKGKTTAKAARMTLQMSKSSASGPPVKPITPPKVEEKEEEDSKGKAKEEEKTPVAPIGESLTAENLEETPVTPRLGDEGFPSVGVPPPSDSYRDLSVLSSQHEGMQSDVVSLTHQVRNLLRVVGEQNIKVASFQEGLRKMQEDKSHFMSDVLDRIRALERRQGNVPPLATPSSSLIVSPPAVEEKEKEAPSQEDLRKMMEDFKRGRKY